MNYRSIFVLILLPITILSSASSVSAEEIVVTIEDNGGGSSNEVQVESNTETTVEQNNEADVENNVDAEANTGDNEANGNSGEETNIETGDASVETNVENKNINENSAETPPCDCNGDGTQINVSNNGAGSHNSVETSVGGSNTTTQNNTANITNNVNTKVNTGNNSAVANGGDVNIKTGSIYSETKVVNKNVNINHADDQESQKDGVKIKVSGNGTGSKNNVKYENVKNTVYAAKNVANIYNNVEHDLNTGGNKADFNLGDVWIGTGDVVAVTDIINKGINVNDYTKTCACEKPGNGDDVTPPVTLPTKPPHHNGESRDNGDGGGNGGNGENGAAAGAVNGEVLPVTGQFTYLFLTLSAIILFLAGWYLRFRSGLAPGVEALS